MHEDHFIKRRWRDYVTASGRRPVKDFLDTLSDQDAANIVAGMHEVTHMGLQTARHLRGDIYEVRIDGNKQTFRILFAAGGRYNHILVSLEGFSKKTPKTPSHEIELAERRLADWRVRGKQ